VIGESDRNVVFDEDGNSLGITLRDAMAAIGLKEYDEDEHPTSSLTQRQIDNSYSVVTREGGGDRIFRVRRTGMEPGVAKQWEILTPTGIDQSLTLDTLIMDAGETFTLAFLADSDEDRLPAVLESINGCMDSPADADRDGIADSVDTDGDGLDDRFELLVGWTVEVERGSFPVRSQCSADDTDNDGRTDDFEAPAVIERDEAGLIVFSTGNAPKRDTSGPKHRLLGWALEDPVTDPTSADTDLDGLSDDFELTPYRVRLLSPPAPADTFTKLLTTSPEHFDSDRDTASDGVEVRVGGNPRRSDFGNFGDNDGDGVVNVLEGVEYDVTAHGVSSGGVCDSVCAEGAVTTTAVTSDPDVADTDGDGLDDGEERTLGTNPRGEAGLDSDNDGLSDYEEVRGFDLRDVGTISTDPLDADTDDDKRGDGTETAPGGRLIIRVAGEAPYAVFSSPIDPDEDLDRLVDGDEASAGTDTGNFNTDGDNRSDHGEVSMTGRRPLVPDLRVRVSFNGLEVEDDGDEDDHAGNFEFAIGVRKPDGALWCEGQPGCGDVEQMPFTSWQGGPHEIAIRDCEGDRFLNGACRWSSRQINIQSGYRLPPMDKQILLGSVSTMDGELETFELSGFFEEHDEDGVDCSTTLPNVQAGEHSGIVVGGPGLAVGTTTLKITPSFGCKGGDPIKFTLLVSYTAD
jgi:hypothetical protein